MPSAALQSSALSAMQSLYGRHVNYLLAECLSELRRPSGWLECQGIL
jgi:hypothetical protein